MQLKLTKLQYKTGKIMILMREMHYSIVESLYEFLVGPCSSIVVIIFITVLTNLLFEKLLNTAVNNLI